MVHVNYCVELLSSPASEAVPVHWKTAQSFSAMCGKQLTGKLNYNLNCDRGGQSLQCGSSSK